MDQIVNILTYISIISGGLLLVLMLLSLVGGLDLDVDIGETDVDSGGLGVFKTALTFLSIGAWVGKVVVVTTNNTGMAIVAAIVSGALAAFILATILRVLLKNQKFVETSPDLAIGKQGKTYLKIPSQGSGIVQVTVDKTSREFKAKSSSEKEIGTGVAIYVEDYRDGYLIVSELN